MKSKFILVLFMTVVVFGGFSLFITNNPLYQKSQPAYITFHGSKTEAIGGVDLNRQNLSYRGSGGNYNQGNNTVINSSLKSTLPKAVSPTRSVRPSINNTTRTEKTSYSYGSINGVGMSQSSSYGSAPSRNMQSNTSSGSAGINPVGMYGNYGKSSSANSGMASSRIYGKELSAVTTLDDEGIPAPDTQLPGGYITSSDPGGDPGGPPIPIGDGIWILLLLSMGYGAYKKVS